MAYKKRYIIVREENEENEGIIDYLLSKGILDKYTDTIVTNSGREFLYQKKFQYVINYQDYMNYIKPEPDSVIDLVDLYEKKK